VLDIWFNNFIRKKCKGEAYIVRYADDFVCCFQYESEANYFYKELKDRLNKFNLQIAEDKTKFYTLERMHIMTGNLREHESQNYTKIKPLTS